MSYKKIKNKKIVLISTYCDTTEKQEILKTNIEKIKMIGLDVMINSPINLPLNIIKDCDYYFLTKDNPTLEWPERAIYIWKRMKINNQKITLNTCQTDYGWANMYQIKKLSEIALTFDYDKFYHIIYDTIIDNIVIDSFLSNDKNCNFYHFHEHKVSFHLMVFNRENLIKFLPYITLDSYLSNGGIVEKWLENILPSIKFNYTIENKYVDDKILFNGHNVDVHNYSKINNLSFFIEKDDILKDNIKLYFYNNNSPKNIKMEIMNVISVHNVSNGDFIDLGYNPNNIKNTYINYNGEKQNITNDIINIKHNTIKKEDITS